MELNYVTTNSYKFELASQLVATASSGEVSLRQLDLATPELQSSSVEEVSKTSAEWAAKEVGEPVVVMDVGFSITALNGFPGPFIKFVNEWLTPEDILAMMRDKTDRSAHIIDSLSYASPNGDSVGFTAITNGEIAVEPGNGETKWPIDTLFIPDGYISPLSTMTSEEKLQMWSTMSAWQRMINFVITHAEEK